MSWLFSQALVEAFSAGTSLDGEQWSQLNVMPTPHKFWRNDKTMDASDLSRFGLTLRLLTESHGQELLTSYLRAFPARTSARPAKAQELMESEADFGFRLSGSFARFSHSECTWKTRQCSLLGGLEEFSGTWPSWGSMRNGECSEVRPLEWTLSGSASGLLPAPQASDGPKWYVVSKESAAKRPKDGRQMMMVHVVGLTAYEHLSKWWLNPQFSEAVMGWPTRWTDLKPLGMDKFREWQQQHGGF